MPRESAALGAAVSSVEMELCRGEGVHLVGTWPLAMGP